MKILITGSEGFVGGHFSRYFDSKHCQVLGIDTRHPYSPIDCRDFFRESHMRFDLVIHCAAVIPNIDDREKNSMPVAGNLQLDAAMFEWAMRTQPGKVVYFSSSAAYPSHLHSWDRGLQEDDIDLDDLSQPNGVYGLVKLVGEVTAREAQRQGLDVLVVRPQSIYGPRQSLSYPFSSFIDKALRRCDPFEVWGSGQQARDFIHIDDAIEAIITMIEVGENGPINIGTGIPISMADLATEVCRVAGYDPEMVFLEDKPDGASALCANPDLLLKYHTPQVTLEEGIQGMLGL